MRMQVILDSSFTRLGSAPIWGGKKGEFRDWTTNFINNNNKKGAVKQQLLTICHPRVVASTFCVLVVASLQSFYHPSVDMVSHLEENNLRQHQDLDSFQ